MTKKLKNKKIITKRSHRIIITSLLLVVAFTCLIRAFNYFPDYTKLRAIEQNQATANATVLSGYTTKSYLGKAGFSTFYNVVYKFQASGTEYSGRGGLKSGINEYKTALANKEILIRYDNNNPNYNTTLDSNGSRTLLASIFINLGISAVFIYIAIKLIKK